jgi:hypothetical protein
LQKVKEGRVKSGNGLQKFEKETSAGKTQADNTIEWGIDSARQKEKPRKGRIEQEKEYWWTVTTFIRTLDWDAKGFCSS